VALALTLPVMAKSDKPATDAKPKNATLTLDAPVKFGSTMVKAGTYKIVIDNEKATLENGNKAVASVAGHWQEGKQKAESTGFETTSGQVDEIFLHGDSSVFVVSTSELSKN
jgi:lipopolysaccharide export system protein LptA